MSRDDSPHLINCRTPEALWDWMLSIGEQKNAENTQAFTYKAISAMWSNQNIFFVVGFCFNFPGMWTPSSILSLFQPLTGFLLEMCLYLTQSMF